MTATDPRRASGATTVWALSATLAIAGVAMLFVLPPPPLTFEVWTPLVAIVVLTLAFALAESFLVHLPVGRHAQSFSIGEVPLVVGLYVAAPWAIGVARLLGAGLAMRRLRVAPVKLAFTVGQFLFETAFMVAVWRLLLGTAPVLSPRGWMAAIVAVIAGDVLSSVLLTAAVRLHDGGLERGSYAAAVRSGIAPAVVNSAFGLTVVFVLSVDWRAVWLPGMVSALLYLAHRANLALTRRHDALQQLNEFAGVVVGDLRVETVAGEVLTELRRQLQADVAQLTVRSEGQERSWASDPAVDLAALASGTDEALLIKRTTKDPAHRRLLQLCGAKDAMVVALPGEGVAMGALVVANRVGDYETFDDEDLEVLHALANHTAAALRNAELTDELRLQLAENEHRALHDALTELPNRRLLTRRVDEAGRTVAVMMMDLNGFKDINDALGHATGDVLLQLVAERLTERLPSARCVARIGGDEFVLVFDADGERQGLGLANAVRRLFAEPFKLRDMTLSVDASVGVAVEDSGVGAAELLKRADVAMYQAKAARAGVRLYDPERDRSSPERLLLPRELRDAIVDGGLTVHYQPKATLQTNGIESFEALARWNHPRRGMVPPDEFIPLAEQTGIIVALTHHVVESALAECKRWRGPDGEISVAVNMSPRVLHDEGFPDFLAAALQRHGLPPTALTLEITESDLMADPDRALEILTRLDEMGITLSVDDLGTGYSSLAYLKRLPVREVKIDRSFVMQMGSDEDDAAIVEAVVALGQRLGKRVVAEGVEDAETYARLREIGCDVAQGYWLSRPMPAGDVLSWLAARRRQVSVV